MYGIGVFSVGQRTGQGGFLLVGAEIDEGNADVAASHFAHGAVLRESYAFGESGHGVAEFVCSNHFGVVKFGITAIADAVGSPVVFACAAFGTAEEERTSALARCEEYPCGAYLLVGKAG